MKPPKAIKPLVSEVSPLQNNRVKRSLKPQQLHQPPQQPSHSRHPPQPAKAASKRPSPARGVVGFTPSGKTTTATSIPSVAGEETAISSLSVEATDGKTSNNSRNRDAVVGSTEHDGIPHPDALQLAHHWF